MPLLIQVGPGEIAPGDESRTGALKEPWRDEPVSPDGRNLPRFILLVFRIEKVTGVVSFQWSATGKRNRVDTGDRRQLVQHLVLHAHDSFRFPHLGVGNRNTHQLDLLGISEPWPDASQCLEGANHQARADQQHQR